MTNKQLSRWRRARQWIEDFDAAFHASSADVLVAHVDKQNAEIQALRNRVSHLEASEQN